MDKQEEKKFKKAGLKGALAGKTLKEIIASWFFEKIKKIDIG